MRHLNSGRRLNRTSSHRIAMFANMACALIKHEQITTTLPKAKELRPIIEKLVTRGEERQRQPARAASGDLADQGRGDGGEAVRCAGPALRRASGRLCPCAEGRQPLRRQRADGGDRIRRSRSRSQGQGFRSGRDRGHRRSRRANRRHRRFETLSGSSAPTTERMVRTTACAGSSTSGPSTSKSMPLRCASMGATNTSRSRMIMPKRSNARYGRASDIGRNGATTLLPSSGGSGSMLNTARMALSCTELISTCTNGDSIGLSLRERDPEAGSPR